MSKQREADMTGGQKIFNIDTFGELIDGLLEKGDIHFKIRMPSGTMESEITENIGAGPVMQFYVLIRTMPHIIEELTKTENLDKNKIPDLLDSLFTIMKHDILEDLGFEEVCAAGCVAFYQTVFTGNEHDRLFNDYYH